MNYLMKCQTGFHFGDGTERNRKSSDTEIRQRIDQVRLEK